LGTDVRNILLAAQNHPIWQTYLDLWKAFILKWFYTSLELSFQGDMPIFYGIVIHFIRCSNNVNPWQALLFLYSATFYNIVLEIICSFMFSAACPPNCASCVETSGSVTCIECDPFYTPNQGDCIRMLHLPNHIGYFLSK